MSKYLILSLLTLLPACKNDDARKHATLSNCKATKQSQHSFPGTSSADFFKMHFDFGVFTNLEEGIKCSKALSKPLFIMFVHNPPTGIFKSIQKSYREQLAYYFSCKKCQDLIRRKSIPVLLHTDNVYDTANIQSKLTESKVLLNKIIANSENPHLDSTFVLSKDTLINRSIQIVTTASLSHPNYVLLTPDGEILAKYGDLENPLIEALERY